jgi:hypothetical protein
MFGSAVLDVAIGLSFVFVLTSLLCSAVQEWISAAGQWRARILERGIRSLLLDGAGGQGSGLTALLYAHPLISGLTVGKVRPSYIPPRAFVRALLDIVVPPPGAVSPIAAAQASAGNLPAGRVRDLVVRLLAEAGNDVEEGRRKVEQWFNDAMDRVSGFYKRRAQLTICLIAIAICSAGNVDAIAIGNRLIKDPALRAQVVQKASSGEAASPAETLSGLNLPVGWPDRGWPQGRAPQSVFLLDKTLGVLLTALAASLGAPFWFDILGKLVDLRTSGRRPEEPARKGETR